MLPVEGSPMRFDIVLLVSILLLVSCHDFSKKLRRYLLLCYPAFVFFIVFASSQPLSPSTGPQTGAISSCTSSQLEAKLFGMVQLWQTSTTCRKLCILYWCEGLTCSWSVPWHMILGRTHLFLECLVTNDSTVGTKSDPVLYRATRTAFGLGDISLKCNMYL